MPNYSPRIHYVFLLYAGALSLGCAGGTNPDGLDASEPAFDAGAPRGVDAASTHDAGGATPLPDAAASCEPMVVAPPDILFECPTCAGARCVSGDLLEPEQRAALAPCSSTHVCLPDEYLLNGPAYVPPTCEAAFGAEGRCLSTCLPGIAAQLDSLQRDSCPETHRCVPCFHPLTGVSTGACDSRCDEGPQEEPVVVTPCCDNRGLCVPADRIDPDNRPYYETCSESTDLCIPAPFVADPDYRPAACHARALAAEYGEQYERGVCAHICQAGIAEIASTLAQEDCADDFLCIPCLDPQTGEPSGACAEER